MHETQKSTHDVYPQGNSHCMQKQIIQCNDKYAIATNAKKQKKENHD